MLVDRDLPRAKAVATDMHYGVPLSPLIDVHEGDYDDLADAGLVLTAGVNEKAAAPPTARIRPDGRLLDANIKVFEDIVPRLVKVAPTAPILVVTDPPEPLIE